MTDALSADDFTSNSTSIHLLCDLITDSSDSQSFPLSNIDSNTSTITPDENSSWSSVLKNETFKLVGDEYLFDRLDVRATFIVLYTIVFCFCFFGNLMVILVVTLHWRMRNITKFCLGNLAFANFCVGVFCIYQNLLAYLIQSWVLGEFMCKMYQFITALSHTASILILVVICVERYLAILHPFQCKQHLTINRLRLLIVAVWLASAIYCSPRLYYIITFTSIRFDGSKEIICLAQRTIYNSKAFDLINFVLLFLVPLVVISFLYIRVGRHLWRSSKNNLCWTTEATNTPESDTLTQSSSVNLKEDFPVSSSRAHSVRLTTARKLNSDHEDISQHLPGAQGRSSLKLSPQSEILSTSFMSRNSTSRRADGFRRGTPSACPDNRKEVQCSRKFTQSRNIHCGKEALKSKQSVVKMLIVIVVTFAVCNFPFHLRKMCQNWCPKYDFGSAFSTLLTPLTHLSMYANCAINPIIYAFMSEGFRSSFKDLLCCRFKKRSSLQMQRLHSRSNSNR